jgi:ElaB/YqjD/DUF883 family membrane-anchored ribosome-binding protein
MARTSISSDFDARLDSLKDSVKDLLDAGSERASNFKDSALTGANKVGGLIKAHPVAAVAIAFGVGYLVMRMIRR